MTLETLKTLINGLKHLSDRTSKLYNNGVDLIDYNNDFHSVINLLLKDKFNTEQLEWVEWFCFEKDYGRAKKMRAWDKEGNEICKDVEGLYKLLKEENDKKE